MARSTGLFPREKFDLDAAMEVPFSQGVPIPSPVDLRSLNTIRVIILGAGEMDPDPGRPFEVTDNAIVVIIGGELVAFWADDIDINGVAIKYLRGSLLDPSDNTFLFHPNGCLVERVYIDAVDNVG
jgi:hypothetical protein